MKIDLSKLKLRPRDSEAFYLQARGSDIFLEEIGGKFLAPIQVEMAVENTGMIFTSRGNVKTLLQLPCSRCLEDFAYSVDADFEVAMVENINSDQFSADEGIIFFNNNVVDISSIVEEAIFMAIAITPLCRGDCQGLCPVCGQDKNTVTCTCVEKTIDPRWEKLKNLQ